jgi:hypothetical protein
MNHVDLLKQAQEEIISLRKQNDILTARVRMFDDMMLLLKAAPVYPGGGLMGPDIVYDINKTIAAEEKLQALTKAADDAAGKLTAK